MSKKLFWPEEQAAFKPPTEEELAKIDQLSDEFDADSDLQKQYGNFYEYLAGHIRKKEGRP